MSAANRRVGRPHAPPRFPELIEGWSFLDPPSDALSGPVGKTVLSGTWLGHAVHRLLTDLPIGFSTSAWMLDLVGGKRPAPAARKLVGLGILAAVPTAATGASDCPDTAAASGGSVWCRPRPTR